MPGCGRCGSRHLAVRLIDAAGHIIASSLGYEFNTLRFTRCATYRSPQRPKEKFVKDLSGQGARHQRRRLFQCKFRPSI
jgi:hypothetical protein